jgi:hypothetical protein
MSRPLQRGHTVTVPSQSGSALTVTQPSGVASGSVPQNPHGSSWADAVVAELGDVDGLVEGRVDGETLS